MAYCLRLQESEVMQISCLSSTLCRPKVSSIFILRSTHQSTVALAYPIGGRNMEIVSFLAFLCLLIMGFQEPVHGRLLSVSKPNPGNAAATARWLVAENSWGVLNTISSELNGAPFGNVVSFSDGLPNEGKGIPYFYLTALDPTAKDATKDERASLTLSEYPLGTCGKIDPENPTCAKLTLTGKLKIVENKSEEAQFAQKALFTKHPEMKEWPKSHKFQFFKLEIENLFLIDWFGGPKPLTPEEYLHPKMNNLHWMQ